MPSTRKNGVRTQPTTPAATKAATAPRPAGLDQNTILLAALALANDGTAEIPFSAYGEVMARQADIKGVTVEPGLGGLEVTVEYHVVEEDDATEDDVVAVKEVTKSAYTPAGPASDAGVRTTAPAVPSVQAPKVGPAADRPSFTRPDALANTGA